MMYLHLFITFFKIGAFTFGGGYASLPLIEAFVVEDNGWLTSTEMIDVVSISNMTPGPIAINAATFVGTKVAGVPGSIVATAGVVTPSAIIMLALGYLIFQSNKNINFLNKMLIMLRPAVIGLIGVAALNMTIESLFPQGINIGDFQINMVQGICFIVGLVLYWKKLDLTKLIILGAGMGIGLSLIL